MQCAESRLLTGGPGGDLRRDLFEVGDHVLLEVGDVADVRRQCGDPRPHLQPQPFH